MNRLPLIGFVLGVVLLFGPRIQFEFPKPVIPTPTPDVPTPVPEPSVVDWAELNKSAADAAQTVRSQTPDSDQWVAERDAIAEIFRASAKRADEKPAEKWDDAAKIRTSIIDAISPRRYLDWFAATTVISESLRNAATSGKLKPDNKSHAAALRAIAEGIASVR